MWPRTIYIHGVGIPVESWEEIDELIKRYGNISLQGTQEEGKRILPVIQQRPTTTLNHADKALLKSFADSKKRGLLNREIGQALGKSGKSIRPALHNWSRRIGLTDPAGPLPFEATSRPEGRGFRLNEHSIKVAHSLLGED